MLADLSKMSTDELKDRLKKLRAERVARYTAPRTKARKKRDDDVLPSLQGVDADIAAKILEELLKGEELQ